MRKEMAFKKGIWSPEEDRTLIAYINRYGIWNWCKMAEPAGLLRSGKSCRLRWRNYLRPGIIHGNYTREEEETIIRMHKVLGNKWAKIAAALPGRTDNEIKNYWHTHLRKRTEKPLIKQTNISSTSGNENKFDSLELDHALLPKYDSGEDSISSMLYGPSSSSDSASIETSETEQKKEAVIDNFWEMLYLESLKTACHDSGSANYYNDQWEPGPQSPLGIYDDPHNDLWSNPTNMGAILDAIINFE